MLTYIPNKYWIYVKITLYIYIRLYYKSDSGKTGEKSIFRNTPGLYDSAIMRAFDARYARACGVRRAEKSSPLRTNARRFLSRSVTVATDKISSSTTATTAAHARAASLFSVDADQKVMAAQKRCALANPIHIQVTYKHIHRYAHTHTPHLARLSTTLNYFQ